MQAREARYLSLIERLAQPSTKASPVPSSSSSTLSLSTRQTFQSPLLLPSSASSTIQKHQQQPLTTSSNDGGVFLSSSEYHKFQKSKTKQSIQPSSSSSFSHCQEREKDNNSLSNLKKSFASQQKGNSETSDVNYALNYHHFCRQEAQQQQQQQQQQQTKHQQHHRNQFQHQPQFCLECQPQQENCQQERHYVGKMKQQPTAISK
eukprot:Awhi_evm1s6567